MEDNPSLLTPTTTKTKQTNKCFVVRVNVCIVNAETVWKQEKPIIHLSVLSNIPHSQYIRSHKRKILFVEKQIFYINSNMYCIVLLLRYIRGVFIFLFTTFGVQEYGYYTQPIQSV